MKIIKYSILIILVFISYLLIIPNKENLFINGFLNPSGDTVEFSVDKSGFKSYLQSAGLPLVIRVDNYDLLIVNTTQDYDVSFFLTFGKDDPVFPYLIKYMGQPIEKVTDAHPGFEIKAGDKYYIKDIPVDIAISSKFGELGVCGLNTNETRGCPELSAMFGGSMFENLRVTAFPDKSNSSVIIQLILITLFWILIINGVIEFFRKRK